MKAELKEQKFEYLWHEPDNFSGAKIGTITFDNHSGDWKFKKCEFVGTNITYGIADWTFLRDLANEILRLNKEIGGGSNE